MSRARVAILISGTGSNMAALLAADIPMDVVLVLSNNPDASGLQKAEAAGVATAVVNHRAFATREAFDQALIAKLELLNVDWVCLAGFMRRLTPQFVAAFQGRVLNIHPSLLPKYPGLNTYQRALEAGETEVGATVHLVTEDLDAGPILAQQAVPVLPDDTIDTLRQKVQACEHEMPPQTAALNAS